MVIWRISRHRDLSGLGGLRASGRWHHRGQPVVYLSENPASALLEICVHTAANDIPPEYTLLRIEGPDLAIDTIAVDSPYRGLAGEIRRHETAWYRLAPLKPSGPTSDSKRCSASHHQFSF